MSAVSQPTKEPESFVVDIADTDRIKTAIEKAEQRLLDAQNERLAVERQVVFWKLTVDRLRESAKVGVWGPR